MQSIRALPFSIFRPGAGRWKARAARGCTRLLLFAYTLLMLKPAMPVIMDGLAHAFWKNVHLAVVHKINGKEHVHYELRKAINDTGKEKGGVTAKWAAGETPHLAAFLPGARQIFLSTGPACPSSTYAGSFYKDAFPGLDVPPPKG